MRWASSIFASLAFAVLPACTEGTAADAGPVGESESLGDGDDDDETGDGDGEPGDGDGDGEPGDGDGDGDPGDGDGDSRPRCNGHVELCDRPYDEVVFAGTHNAHAVTTEGFSQFNANQIRSIPIQLEDGIRVMLIDTYYDGDTGEIVLCHGPCQLGSTPHAEVLAAIVEFLLENPGEVLTLIYQDQVSPEDLALDYELTGAIDLVYVHPTGQLWPTLGEMVEADTRLVVTAEQGSPPPAWHHNIWALGWDTPYGPQDPDDLSCELNRGSSEHDLFLVNHWVNNAIGLPSPTDAELVNAYDFLLARAQECWARWDHPPNFLAVDFYDRGDLLAVVETLNGF
jgi:hypothetical protein